MDSTLFKEENNPQRFKRYRANVELLKKMFPTILNMKYTNGAQKIFFQNSAKDRLTHFNISVKQAGIIDIKREIDIGVITLMSKPAKIKRFAKTVND